MKKQIILYLLLLLIGVMANAQSGTIRGRVFNQKNNSAVPFANLIIDGTNIGTSSNFEGEFVFTGIKPGFYKIKASSIGYDDYITVELQVTTSKPLYIDIALKEKIKMLDVIEIKSETFKKNTESPVAMQSIGISEIEKNPGSNRDISKIVQNFPGVGQTAVQRNDLIVRGGGASENRFYVDGIEFPNLNHFATQGASGGPAGIINPDFLRSADFYTGSFRASYGNALSSILDMSLIQPNKDKSTFRLTLGASDLGFTTNTPISNSSGLLFSVRRSYLQFLFKAIGLPFLPVYNDYLVKYTKRIDEKNQLTIISLGALDQSRLNLEENKTELQRYILNYLPETDQWNYTIGGIFKHFSKNGFDNYILSRNMFRNKSYKFEDNIKSDSLKIQDYSSDETENKFRWERHRFKNDSKWISGFGIENAEYVNNTFNRIFIQNSPVEILYKSKLSIFKYSLFGQYSNTLPGNRFSFSIGLRADGNTYNKKMSNPVSQLSPRISASYSINEKWSLNTNLAYYSQLPAYTIMGFKDNNGDFVNKNNGLKYINAFHAIAGISFSPDENTKLSLESFMKIYNHYPVSVRDSVSMANKGGDFGVVGDEPVLSNGKGRAYGTELLIRRKLLDKLTFLATYTFVRSEFSGLNGKFIPSSWDSRHIINILLSRKLQKNWTIGAKWKFSGGAPYTPYDLATSSSVLAWNLQGRAYIDYSQYNEKRLKPFHQLDIRVDKEIFLKKWSLNLYLDVQNVYNFKALSQPILLPESDNNGNFIIENPGAPSAEQIYRMKEIKNLSGNILPTIGVIIEF